MGSRFQQKEQHQFMMCHQSIWCSSEQTKDEAEVAGGSPSMRSESRAEKPRDDLEQDGQSQKALREKEAWSKLTLRPLWLQWEGWT